MVATVTGNLVAVTGSVRAGVELQFEPRSLPLAEEGSLVVSPSTSVTTDANGDFTAALVAGDYRMFVGQRRFACIRLHRRRRRQRYGDFSIDQPAWTWSIPAGSNIHDQSVFPL